MRGMKHEWIYYNKYYSNSYNNYRLCSICDAREHFINSYTGTSLVWADVKSKTYAPSLSCSAKAMDEALS